MAKTLVTGATGFTGFNLCKKLLEDGDQVVAFVREGPRVERLKTLGIECRYTDITNPESVNDNFYDIERVYHLAAAYRTEHADKSEFDLVNVNATKYLLDAAGNAKVKRFVHCSTVGVQGEIEHPPAREEYRYKPGDHYQESKLNGERLAVESFSAGLPGAVVRPVGIYGPGDTRFLKLFKPINKGYFVMIGSGKVFYHMTYIDDLVKGFLLCGKKDEALGQIFTIGGAEYTTLRQLVHMIADTLDKPRPRLRVPYFPVYVSSVLCEVICRTIGIVPPLYPRRVEFFHLDRAFSIGKARQLLGYQPQIGLQEGLERTAAWYKEKDLV